MFQLGDSLVDQSDGSAVFPGFGISVSSLCNFKLVGDQKYAYTVCKNKILLIFLPVTAQGFKLSNHVSIVLCSDLTNSVLLCYLVLGFSHSPETVAISLFGSHCSLPFGVHAGCVWAGVKQKDAKAFWRFIPETPLLSQEGLPEF